MLMKLLNFVISTYMGQMQSQPAEPSLLRRFSMLSVRKVLMVSAGLLMSGILFFGGFFTVLLDLILTSRDNQQLMLSMTSAIGFALIGISVLMTAGLFNRKLWKLPVYQAPVMETKPSPVNEAVAELIRDFVDERREMRQREAAFAAAAMAASAAMDEGQLSSAESQPNPSISPAYN